MAHQATKSAAPARRQTCSLAKRDGKGRQARATDSAQSAVRSSQASRRCPSSAPSQQSTKRVRPRPDDTRKFPPQYGLPLSAVNGVGDLLLVVVMPAHESPSCTRSCLRTVVGCSKSTNGGRGLLTVSLPITGAHAQARALQPAFYNPVRAGAFARARCGTERTSLRTIPTE